MLRSAPKASFNPCRYFQWFRILRVIGGSIILSENQNAYDATDVLGVYINKSYILVMIL